MNIKNSPHYLIINCCHIVNAKDLVSPFNHQSVTENILFTQSMLSNVAKDYIYTLQNRLFQILLSPLNVFKFEGVFVLWPKLFFVKCMSTSEENNKTLVYFSEAHSLTTKIRIIP